MGQFKTRATFQSRLILQATKCQLISPQNTLEVNSVPIFLLFLLVNRYDFSDERECYRKYVTAGLCLKTNVFILFYSHNLSALCACLSSLQ